MNLELTPSRDLNYEDQYHGPSTKFKALVRDETTDEVLEDAEVKFFVDGKAIESEFSKENGKTVFKSPEGKDYMMLVSRTGYQDLIYHMPGAPQDNTDIDLAMYKSEGIDQPAYRHLAVQDRVYDDFTGTDLDGVAFKVFENGELIETTDNLSTVEIDPQKEYQILATKQGYQANMIRLEPEQLNQGESTDLPIAMRSQEVSESTGELLYENSVDGIPLVTNVVDVTNDQPVSEAKILVFADNQYQGQLTTWKSGEVTLNTIPGKDYKLVVQRDGYNDRIIALGKAEATSNESLDIA